LYRVEQLSEVSEDFRRALQEQRGFRPLYVKVKLIYGCNLKCEMCNHWREHREAPLPMPRFREVLQELASLGCQKIHLSGGEPLLRGEVPELISTATAAGLRVTMTSNGTLISKDMAKSLLRAGLRGVNISVDSPIRKIHDKIRGSAGAWKKTLRAIEYFRRYSSKGKITIRLNTVVSRWNYDSLASLPDLAAKIGADAINLIPVDDHCGEYLSLAYKHIEYYNRVVAPQIATRALELKLIRNEQEAYPFGRTKPEIKRARRGEYALGWYEQHPCFAPWTHSLIDYNGLVYVCCMTREKIEPLGDLKKQSFTELWNGEAYRRIRGLMDPPSLSPCRRCDDFLKENKQIWNDLTR